MCGDKDTEEEDGGEAKQEEAQKMSVGSSVLQEAITALTRETSGNRS